MITLKVRQQEYECEECGAHSLPLMEIVILLNNDKNVLKRVSGSVPLRIVHEFESRRCFASKHTSYCMLQHWHIHQGFTGLFSISPLDVTNGPKSPKLCNPLKYLFCFDNWKIYKSCRPSPNHSKGALPQTKGQLYITPSIRSLFCEYRL